MLKPNEVNYRCLTCRHYGFYKMITHGPYGYAGEIPCISCVHFSFVQDNYEPVSAPYQNNKEVGDVEG